MEKRLHITPIGDEGMYILDTASWRVYRPVMDKEKCIDCGMCLAFCPVNAVAAVVLDGAGGRTVNRGAPATRSAPSIL